MVSGQLLALPSFSRLSLRKEENESRLISVGTPAGGNDHLNHRGAQSTRPIPRWYWMSYTQKRWRRFDGRDGMATNTALEKNYKNFPNIIKGNAVYKFHYNGKTLYITSWDTTNLRGTFKKEEEQTHDTKFERLSPSEAADVQADNFVYDYSRPEDQTNQSFLLKHQHCIPYFREMLHRELYYSKSHVFLYHSYHTVSLIYDLGACLRRISLPQTSCALDSEAIMLRTDRSAFNLRTPSAIKSHFNEWYNGSDVWGTNPEYQKFAWVGISVVLNLFRTNPESTVVHDFQKGYNPGDSPDLNPVLDELLNRFGIKDLREQLLQLTIEADTDVSSFFVGSNPNFFQRSHPGENWAPVDPLWANHMRDIFYEFMENDRKTDRVTTSVGGWTVYLEREYPGAQAQGEASRGRERKELITVTTNPGRYAQIGIPIELINELAYASKPYGVPDLSACHALDKIATRVDLSSGGQARLFPRPDLMCHPRILNKTYMFSRGAQNKRTAYLNNMQTLITRHLASPERLTKIGYQFAPPDIVVLTHNVDWKNKKVPKLVSSITVQTYSATFSFACIQECTTNMIRLIKSNINSSTYEILYKKVPNSSEDIYGCIIYDKSRFNMVGGTHLSCFYDNNNEEDRGRPIFGAVFMDTYLSRRLLVMSVHAPHGNYTLMTNIQREVDSILTANNTLFDGVSHFVLAGDYNREDWYKDRWLQFGPFKVHLRSAQRPSNLQLTLNKHKSHAEYPRNVDNVLYGSSRQRYVLEQKSALTVSDDTLGSDHNPVTVTFRC